VNHQVLVVEGRVVLAAVDQVGLAAAAGSRVAETTAVVVGAKEVVFLKKIIIFWFEVLGHRFKRRWPFL